jgi:hypothetical protein
MMEMLSISIIDGALHFSGDTFPLRSYLRAWGGQWVADRRVWKFSNMTFKELVSNLKSLDLDKLEVDTKRHCIYHGLYSHHMIDCFIQYNLCHSERYNYILEEQGCSCKNGRTCLLCASGCCKLATIKQCVCTLSTQCLQHGDKCIGTHD